LAAADTVAVAVAVTMEEVGIPQGERTRRHRQTSAREEAATALMAMKKRKKTIGSTAIVSCHFLKAYSRLFSEEVIRTIIWKPGDGALSGRFCE
jgi:hypothetical protein